jgi:hypothetical protein
MRFARESSKVVQHIGEDLDRDVKIQLGIRRAPDFAHAPLTELGYDAIVGDRGLRAHVGVISKILPFPVRDLAPSGSDQRPPIASCLPMIRSAS